MLTRVALFFTGRRHAGEKMAQLPARRAAALAAPIQRCARCRATCRSCRRKCLAPARVGRVITAPDGVMFAESLVIRPATIFSCCLTIICRQSQKRQFLLMLLPRNAGKMLVAIRLSSPADWISGTLRSDHDPAMGLTRDSHRVRRVSTLALLLGAPEGSCLF